MSILDRILGRSPGPQLLNALDLSERLEGGKKAIEDSYFKKITVKQQLSEIINEIIRYLRGTEAIEDWSKNQKAPLPSGIDYKILRQAIFDQLKGHEYLDKKTEKRFSEIFEALAAQSAEGTAVAQNQQRWFLEAINRIPKPIFFLDLTTQKISFSNKAAQTMLGFDYKHSGQSFGTDLRVLDKDGRDVPLEQVPSRRTLRGESIAGDEVILKTLTGEYHTRAFSEHIPAMYGQPASALILFQDITALKKTESDLRATQAELKEAVEIAQVGFWHLDIATQKISVTPILVEQFGFNPATFKSTLNEAMQAMHPDDRDRVSSAITDSISKNIPYHIEYRVVHPSGDIRWIEARGSATYNSMGTPQRFTGTTLDVTERKEAERAIEMGNAKAQLERKKYEEVLKQASAPIVLLEGPEHRFSFANAKYLETFGVVGNPIGKTIDEVFPDAVAQGFKGLLDEVFATGKPFVANEAHFVRKLPTGEEKEFYLDFTYAAKRDSENKIEGILAVVADVTGRVTARKILETSAEEFRTLADSMPQIVWTAGSDGMLDYFNQVWFDYSGTTYVDNVGTGWAKAVHPDDLPGTAERWSRSLKAGQVYENEFRLRAKDGTYRWHVARAIPSRDSQGKIVKWYGTNTDIHEFKTLATQLQEAKKGIESEQQKLRTIFADSSASMAVLQGKNFVYEIANRSYLELFNNREIIGKAFSEALPELVGQEFPIRAKAVFETGIPYVDHEAKAFLRRSAESPLEERYFDQTYSRMLDEEGKPYGVFIHAHEVTDLVFARREVEKASERAEKANSAKSQFLANMSHEIRTPLGAIMGFSNLLKDENLSHKEQEGFLSVIERNSNQLLRIIDDILDLSKVEAGMMLIEQIDFSLPEMLTDFSSLMGFKAREKGIGFSSKAMTALPKMIKTDPTRLRQILMNVVGNAIKFTDKGHVEIRVCYRNGELDFEIEDSGRGISPEQEQNLFQPFTQADTSITRKYGGTGLGLVLTRSLSEALGGHFILKRSALGEGSLFSVKVKVEAKPNVEFVTGLGFETVPARSVINAGQLAGLKILLVEDSPDNQALISIILSRAGAQIDIGSDGAQGVEMAMRGNYDITLMDVQMPVMDGITAIKRLRSEGYQKPVLALTAHAMKEERTRCLQAGFTDFLSKPVNREEMINLILRCRS